MSNTEEIVIFNGQKDPKLPKITKDCTVRIIEEPQPVQLYHFDEVNGFSSTIQIHEGNKQTPILDFDNNNVVSEMQANNDTLSRFLIVQPIEKQFTTLDLKWGDNTLPFMFSKEFFSVNDPIQILPSNWKLPESTSTTTIAPQQGFDGEPPDPEQSLPILEIPAEVVEIANLSEGYYTLDEFDTSSLSYTRQDFIKSLATNAVGGGTGNVVNNLNLLRDFFPSTKFYLKQYNGKYFVIFKGLAGTRTSFRGTKYALQNPKVMTLSVMKGPKAGTSSALKGIGAKSALKGNILTVVIIGVVDLIAWQNGMLSDDGKFVTDLLVEFGMDVAKAVLSTIVAGFLVGAGIVALGLSAASLPAVVVVGATIAVAIVVGMVLDYVDKQYLGWTDTFKNEANKVEQKLTNAFNKNLVQPIIECLYDLEQRIKWYYFKNARIPIKYSTHSIVFVVSI